MVTLGETAFGDSAAVLAVLETIPVKGRAPKTGYDRDLFGQAWSDDVTTAGGHNGCDTRNDILARDLTAVTYKPGTRDCVVVSGVLEDAYCKRGLSPVMNSTGSAQLDPRCDLL